ncbi:endolytic transglycosylase MltG [Streptomyces sp. NPDC058045]|uniref:endolytic transglycosylase MltG n=1 Tax=Streptomyces sp. NPDC058045 TaxID=3346311 RepID=UPI0036E51AD2
MTDYGRGERSDPWHPEDPLYGDLGWSGRQAPTGHYDGSPQQPGPPQDPYAGYDGWGAGAPQAQPAPGQYPADPLTGGPPPPGHAPRPQQSPPYGGPPQYNASPYDPHHPGPYDSGQFDTGGYGTGGYNTGSHGTGGYANDGYGNGSYDTGSYGNGSYDTGSYGTGGYGTGGYAGGAYDTGSHPAGRFDGPAGRGADWDTGGHRQGGYPGDPADPYGNPHPAEHPHDDPYGSAAAYPPPEPPARRGTGRPVPETDWDPGPDQGEQAFFAGGDDGDDDFDEDEPDGSGGRKRRGRGGPGKERKRRSGCACLVVALVFGGGLAGAGYLGYGFYQDRFGPAPDYSGDGSGQQVQVTVTKGSGGYDIGQALKKAGVVKSVDAFVHAQQENPKGQSIQEGVYTLDKEMSAKSAVALMLDPKSHNNLVIAEGRRNSQVYTAIDQRLHLKKGTTAGVAKKEWRSLGLPGWAKGHKNVKDPLEGFLYPSAYPVAKGMKPQTILKAMVNRATSRYQSLDLDAQAKKLRLDGPWQVLTVASLVQVEGKSHEDFRKMSEVVYNRLKPSNTETNQLLQFDSTFNYLKNQSSIDISESEINSNHDPYNTYTQKGLPPGPISNPGDEALSAALRPTRDGWIYFVATDGMNKTEFAKTYAEFQKLKDKFNDHSGT